MAHGDNGTNYVIKVESEFLLPYSKSSDELNFFSFVYSWHENVPTVLGVKFDTVLKVTVLLS